jgi:hypothetical protein
MPFAGDERMPFGAREGMQFKAVTRDFTCTSRSIESITHLTQFCLEFRAERSKLKVERDQNVFHLPPLSSPYRPNRLVVFD